MFRWESAQYYVGQFYDDCYKQLSEDDKVTRYVNILSDLVDSKTDLSEA